jgi:predicted permease
MDLVASLPWELNILLSLLRSTVEIAALLGSATLVVQAITLGTSLLPASGGAAGWRILLPNGRWEWRMLAATSVTRLLVMPICGLGLVHSLELLGWLPDSGACKMAILIQSAMPSAQNLVTLANLTPESKGLAAPLAQLLLRQYVIAIVPMTIWVSVFMNYLQMPVLV